jgi:methionine-rich copper-binding protein CopC
MTLTRRVAMALLAAVALFAAVPLLSAHTALVAAVPAPGQGVTRSPAEIRLTFDGPLQSPSGFQLFAAGFRELSGLNPAIDPERPEELWSSVPALEPGTYTVQWDVVSADGDPVSGSYAFEVLVSASGPASWLLPSAAGFLAVLLVSLLFRRRRSRVT